MHSRKPGCTPAPPTESKSGSEGAPACKDCKESARAGERITISGLRLIRLRFGLHRSELPFLSPTGLKWYLLSLLSPAASLHSVSDGRLRRFPCAHAGWDEAGFPKLVRLSRSDRWELAHSCSSLARSLPPSCARHSADKIPEWSKRATTHPPPSSPAYLQFCRKLVRREFPLGWDQHRYPQAVSSFAPTASARAETKTTKMTASDHWSDLCTLVGKSFYDFRRTFSKAEFSNLTLHGRPVRTQAPTPGPEYVHPPLPFERGFSLRVKSIPTVGKSRVIGIPSLNYDLLGPLHRAVYGHLTSRDWLVHGPITEERVNRVCRGKVQTSVDLVNATDGLRLDVTEAILGALLAKTVSVPGGIKELAFASLYPSFNGGEVVHGQMMGTYLSFPLLCLHSFCAARWAARKSSPVGFMINGDDAGISHDLPLGEYPEGYEKNEAKTLTSTSTVELNSTVFVKVGGKWKEIRHLRRVGAESDYQGFRHMAEACQKAGPRWVSAFVRSGLGKRWAMSPEDLGLSRRHRLVWLRGLKLRGMGSSVEAGRVVQPLNSRYRMVSEEPSMADKIAFGIDLFNVGRSKEGEPEDRNPPRTQVLRTCGPRLGGGPSLTGRRFNAFLSHEFWCRFHPEVKAPEWLVLGPDNPWSQSPRKEEVVEKEEGAYVLAPRTPYLSRPLCIPLAGRLRYLQ